MAYSLSLNKLLDKVPSPQELCENVRTAHWRNLGTMLHLDETDLVNIERRGSPDENLSVMFTVWLQRKGRAATRGVLLEALKSKAVGEVAIAENYLKTLQTEEVNRCVYIIKVYISVRFYIV